ncbi:MAG: maleylpyruvate isomerase N-terminal domain-containing protein [Labilithrix sp.]|nr:maleylpyruvate isomerase N-terminal domain-containing protein [Labilithrix sp.]
MAPLVDVETLSLFPDLNAGLVDLLSSLSADEWRRPTVHRDRDVKDLASHLLDTALRRLAMQRDGWFGPGPEASDWDGLVRFIQRANREWMDAARRLSPRILVEWIRRTDEELLELLRTLPPHGRAIFSVAWAGEAESENWFDVAREYTERWHHQQQIRDAVGRPGCAEARFLNPVIATFARGLPHAYRNVDASVGTAVDVEVDDVRWTIVRADPGWVLAPPSVHAAATVALSGSDAWRLWTKGMSAAEARTRARSAGPDALVDPVFSFVAIMA